MLTDNNPGTFLKTVYFKLEKLHSFSREYITWKKLTKWKQEVTYKAKNSARLNQKKQFWSEFFQLTQLYLLQQIQIKPNIHLLPLIKVCTHYQYVFFIRPLAWEIFFPWMTLNVRHLAPSVMFVIVSSFA